MELDEVLRTLAEHEAELRERHVATLSVFGSVARGEARPDSDVDLLVEFDGSRVSLFDLVDLKDHLASILGRAVDPVTRRVQKRQLRDHILTEAIRAA